MTQTFTENVFIDGAQDADQLRVQGHTTQNEALQTWENSAGDVLGQVTGDGRFQFGDDVGLASPDALVEAHRAEASTTKPKRGFHALGQVSDSLTNVAQWIVQELEIRGTSSLSALQTALRVRASNLNTGTPAAGAELRAADVEVINDAAAGSAALPKATGLQVAVTNAAGKTITQATGLHVKVQNEGTIDTPFTIYAEGAGAHFDDFVEIQSANAVNLFLGAEAGNNRSVCYLSDSSKRWTISTDDLPEGGGNMGSNFAIDRYDDAGDWLDRPLWIGRDDGMVSVNGLVNRGNPWETAIYMDGPAGKNRIIYFRNSTDWTARWVVNVSSEAESGGNAGSNFSIGRCDDSGAGLGQAFYINRASGSVVFGGNIGINVYPSFSLQLASDSAAKPGGGSWSSTSDRRVKRHITPYTNGLDFLRQLPTPVSFEYNGKAETPEGMQSTGFIAQDLQPIAPLWIQSMKGKLTAEDAETDLLYVNNSDLVYVLMNSILELAQRIEHLEAA